MLFGVDWSALNPSSWLTAVGAAAEALWALVWPVVLAVVGWIIVS